MISARIPIAVLFCLLAGCQTADYALTGQPGRLDVPFCDTEQAAPYQANNACETSQVGMVDAAPEVSVTDTRRLTSAHASEAQTVTFIEDAEQPELALPNDPDDSTLTLADFEQMALENNPTLAEASARAEAARGRWLQAGLYPNPVIGYSAEEMGDEGTAGQQGGFVGQEFVTGGKLWLNRAVASQEVTRAEQELAAQQLRVQTDVRTSFYEVLVAQQRIELTENLVQTAENAIELTEKLLKGQQASRVDLLRTQVEANTIRIQLENARNRHQAAWRTLAAVVGASDLPLTTLSGDVEEAGPGLEWEDALARLLTESPELAAATADAEAARWATERARVEWIPNVGVQAGLQHNNASGDNIVGVQVAVPLPLFDRNQGNIVAADAQLVAAERTVERIRLGLHARLAGVFRRYGTARQQVKKYGVDILPDAKETLDLVTSGYQQGELTYLDLLTAQRTYFQSNLAYLDSLLELRLAREQIDGLLLSESLKTPTGQQENP